MDSVEPEIGQRLREIRQARRRTLKSVAGSAGISESFLSQVERGTASASIATLKGVANALGVRMGDLFDGGFMALPKVLRKHERPAIHIDVLGTKYQLTPHPVDNLEVYLAEFDPGGSTGGPEYSHGNSDEFVFVLSGTVEIHVDDEAFVLDAGDSIIYRSSSTHSTKNVGDEPAEVLWVISPPSY